VTKIAIECSDSGPGCRSLACLLQFAKVIHGQVRGRSKEPAAHVLVALDDRIRAKKAKEGLLQKDSPRGIWAITDKGKLAVANIDNVGSLGTSNK